VTLLGDAAHAMHPVGSNGASQAVIDARALADALAADPDPRAALAAYEADRLPKTAAVVRSNRHGGPEGAIDEVERRAPDGFERLDDVISADELRQIVTGYAQMAGFAPTDNQGDRKMSVPPLEAGVRRAEAGLDGLSWNILSQTYVPKSLTDGSFSWRATFPVGTFVDELVLGVVDVRRDVKDADAFRAALEAADFDSVPGKFSFGSNHHPIQDIYLREVVREGDVLTNRTVGVVMEDHQDAYVGECAM
jgi:hypothetical protein